MSAGASLPGASAGPGLHAFSPDALTLQQPVPWVVGRMISLGICTMAVCALVFAWLAPVDIVVSSQGRVIPSGRSKVVQPLESGVVRTIAVRDGQAVKAGDLLVELDPTNARADQRRAQRDFWDAGADVARLALCDKAEEELEAARRQAATLARQAYAGLVNGQAQVEALASAVRSSEAALASNRIGYRIGTRINTDVLNAEQQWHAAQRDWHKARVDSLMSALRLKAAVGELGDADLAASNALLLPRQP